MNRKPKPHPTQKLGVYGFAEGGGCFDIGVMALGQGVGLYHESQLSEMIVRERMYFLPYILSVLAILGTKPEDEK